MDDLSDMSFLNPGKEVPTDIPQAGACRAELRNLSFWYGGTEQALKNINLPIAKNRITALIGPSGCGKTTLLRCINRMHDLYADNRYQGEIRLLPEDENLVSLDALLVRLRIGMVFQKANPFPKSIYENVAAGLRVRGINRKRLLNDHIKQALTDAALWDEVKDRLYESATELSGGQQQRLCIARALAASPEILLLDEPTSALDPIATAKIEDLLTELRNSVTIVIVTHNMQQAARISDFTAYMHLGEIVEYASTDVMFTNPREEKTLYYVTERWRYDSAHIEEYNPPI